MKRLALLAALLVAPSSVAAWDEIERMGFANGLAHALAGEALCGLAYRQEAVRELVATTVPAEDIQFAADLRRMTRAAARDVEGMSPSGVTAYCSMLEQVALHYRFIE